MSIFVKVIRRPNERAEKPAIGQNSSGSSENSTCPLGVLTMISASSEIVIMRPMPRVPSDISIGTTWPRGPIG